MRIALYDACVFYSGALRDLLLHLATAKAVHARWSDEIHEEWIRSLLRNRPDLTRESLERTRLLMNQKFRSGRVKGYQHLIDGLRLPDPNDRHVLAAAIWAKASYIVTYNLDDFPSSTLAPYKIETLTPDEFVLRLIRNNSEVVVRAVKDHRARLSRPPKSVDEYLEALETQRLPKTVAFLREHRNEI